MIPNRSCLRVLAATVPLLALPTLTLAAGTVQAPAVQATAVQTTAEPATADPAPSEVFLDTVDVNVVNLAVSVTDADGNPIHGLTRDDFVVTEDGRLMELSNFYEFRSARRVAPQGASAAGVAEAGGTPVALPPDQRLNLAVAIDNQNLGLGSRKQVLDQLRGELARVVRPGDAVMVVVLDPFPRIEQPFTDDMEAVSAALDRVGRSPVGNLALRREYNGILNELSRSEGLNAGEFDLTYGPLKTDSRALPRDHAKIAEQRIWSYVSQAFEQMRRSFLGVEALVDWLGGLPARKAVLYVSDGLDADPALDIYRAFMQAYPDDKDVASALSPTSAARPYELSDELARVTRAASANGVTFYTLDARGSRSALGGVEATSVTPLVGNVNTSPQETLVQLAAATGGSTMLNPANVKRLVDVMVHDHSDYYSLGFVSERSRDGKFHRLDVRVPGVPRARVHHGEGYRGKPIRELLADQTRSALRLGVEDNPLGVRIELGSAQRQEENRYVLPVLVRVPMSRLLMVPQDSAHRGKLTLCVTVRDDDGGLSEPQRFEVPVEVPDDQLDAAAQRDVGYGFNLLVRGGPANLAVGVRDDVAAVSSTVNVKISTGEG